MTPIAAVVMLAAATSNAEECRCTGLRITDGWCTACRIGYIASVPIKSVLLFEVLDAHGHDIDIRAIACETCRKAYEADGFCEHCRRGFVRQQAYLSPLTYQLARSERVDPTRIECKTCRKNASKSGWCETCGVGRIGSAAIRVKKDYEHAKAAYELLLAAVAKSELCEFCAAAMITDNYCPNCKISYKDGKSVEIKGK